MDYKFFDALLDAVFIVDEHRKIVYCNESAATFCESSIRRLTKGAKFDNVLDVEDASVYNFPHHTDGIGEATPYIETQVTLKAGKSGRVQISVQPYPSPKDQPLWAIIIRDVTLEEMLASKYRGELEQKEEFISQLQEAKKELEAYSKNLEAMVEERTAEVKAANQMLNAIMNSLGQGFLVFDESGTCSDVFTRACIDILETEPGGKSIEGVLKLEGPGKEQFEMWRKAVFSETLPFDTLIDLAPRLFNHSSGRRITLDYYPIKKNGSGIDQLVLVATDKTSEYETSQALEIEKEHAQMTLKIFKGRDQFAQFLKATRIAISALKRQLERSSPENFDADEAFRRLHTMEGEAGAFSAVELRNAARSCQGDLEPLRMLESDADAPALFAKFVNSVDGLSGALDEFMGLHGEVLKALSVDGKTKVEVEEQELRDLLARLRERGVPPSELAPLHDRYLKKPIHQILEHYNNVIHLVAEKQGKHVEAIEFDGENIRLQSQCYQSFFASLVHAFRNAVDHGIEESDVRLMCSKPEAGTIRVSTNWKVIHGGKWIEMIIADDGGGIPADIIREKLKKFVAEDKISEMSDEDVLQYIFHPGLSSRDVVGEFSGRGVGMDAIKTEVLNLGGEVHVESSLGEGTKITILIPEVDGELDLAKSA